MYAWANFVIESNEWGQTTKAVKPGDEVTQEDLQVSDDAWANLIKTGQIREQPYPKIPAGTSPIEYFKHLQAKAAKGKLTAKEVEVLQQRPPVKEAPRVASQEPDAEIEFKLPF